MEWVKRESGENPERCRHCVPERRTNTLENREGCGCKEGSQETCLHAESQDLRSTDLFSDGCVQVSFLYHQHQGSCARFFRNYRSQKCGRFFNSAHIYRKEAKT